MCDPAHARVHDASWENGEGKRRIKDSIHNLILPRPIKDTVMMLGTVYYDVMDRLGKHPSSMTLATK